MLKALVTGMLLSVCAWGWVLGWKDVTRVRAVVLDFVPPANAFEATADDDAANDIFRAFAEQRGCAGLKLSRSTDSNVPQKYWNIGTVALGDVDDGAHYNGIAWNVAEIAPPGSRMIEGKDKTADEMMRHVCEIVKGNGGSIQ